jgi:hypothetical protein
MGWRMHTPRATYINTYTNIDTDIEIETEIDKRRERDRQRERKRHTHTYTERETHTHTHAHRDAPELAGVLGHELARHLPAVLHGRLQTLGRVVPLQHPGSNQQVTSR